MGDFGDFSSCMVEAGHGAGPKGVSPKALAASSVMGSSQSQPCYCGPSSRPPCFRRKPKRRRAVVNGPPISNSSHRQDAQNSPTRGVGRLR